MAGKAFVIFNGLMPECPGGQFFMTVVAERRNLVHQDESFDPILRMTFTGGLMAIFTGTLYHRMHNLMFHKVTMTVNAF
jgi:hypothetical protein